jgi:hypothetical protein
MVNLSDEVNTRASAIKEDLKNSDQKSGTGGKILGDLTNSKEEVKTDSYIESAKNAIIDGIESAKEYFTGNALSGEKK